MRNRIMAQVSKDSTLDVSQEFIESGKSLQSNSKKRGGRYTKDEKLKRLDEVYRLHFEYGYSARKISELMKIIQEKAIQYDTRIVELIMPQKRNYGLQNYSFYKKISNRNHFLCILNSIQSKLLA